MYIYIYVYIYIYTHTHTHKFTSKCRRLPHHRSGDSSQGQETFLAPSADKQTRKYDTVLKPPSLRSLSRSKMKWWVIYTNLSVNALVRPPHPRSGNSQGQETFLAPSNHHCSLWSLSSLCTVAENTSHDYQIWSLNVTTLANTFNLPMTILGNW